MNNFYYRSQYKLKNLPNLLETLTDNMPQGKFLQLKPSLEKEADCSRTRGLWDGDDDGEDNGPNDHESKLSCNI